MTSTGIMSFPRRPRLAQQATVGASGASARHTQWPFILCSWPERSAPSTKKRHQPRASIQKGGCHVNWCSDDVDGIRDRCLHCDWTRGLEGKSTHLPMGSEKDQVDRIPKPKRYFIPSLGFRSI